MAQVEAATTTSTPRTSGLSQVAREGSAVAAVLVVDIGQLEKGVGKEGRHLLIGERSSPRARRLGTRGVVMLDSEGTLIVQRKFKPLVHHDYPVIVRLGFP